MTKNQLIRVLAKRTGFKQYQVRSVYNTFVALLLEQMEKNERLVLKGFGTFNPIVQTTRPVRNPRTGEEMMLIPRTTIKFRPGDDLVRSLNGAEVEADEFAD